MSEMSEHRVSMLGASWRRFEDPTRSRDPRVRALVASLATLPGPQPRAEFRDELRAQLVAIAPRIVAEARDADALIDVVPARPAKTAPAGKPLPTGRRTAARHSDSWVTGLRRIPIARPLAVAASVITAFALLLGGAVWMSKKALPGDTLYGLKRASENAQLAIAGSDTQKASDYLEFAATRASEVRALLSRSAAGAIGRGPQAGAAVNAGTAKLITSTLASADSDVRSASSLLGFHAVRTRSSSALHTMTNWAPGQLARLNAITASMPSGSLQTRAAQSAHLVTQALGRAEALAGEIGCQCLQSSGSDSLGPLPCSGCGSSGSTGPPRPGATPSVVKPGRHPSGATASGSASQQAPVPGQHHGSATDTTSAPPGGRKSSPGLPLPSPPLPSLPLPSLPIPSLPFPLPRPPKQPVTGGSCGLTVSLGLIGVGLGTCSGVNVSVHP
jgi:hypothetical protein